MTLDSIAESIGTIEEPQEDTTDDRVQEESSRDFEDRDVQTEYDGGWSPQ